MPRPSPHRRRRLRAKWQGTGRLGLLLSNLALIPSRPPGRHGGDVRFNACVTALDSKRDGHRTVPFVFVRGSAHSERVFELTLGHLRAALDVPRSRLGIKLPPGVAVRFAGAGNGCAVTARGLLARVASAHRLGALALARGADMRPAFAFLLGGAAMGFLALGAPQVATVAAGAVVF